MGAKTVLVVDDSASVRDQLTELLEFHKLTVLQGSNGVEGLALAKASAIDLIIADVNMPQLDGIAMVELVRHLPGYAKTPIFILTTESGSRIKDGKRAGVTAWIVKPFKSESLVAAVKKVLAL